MANNKSGKSRPKCRKSMPSSQRKPTRSVKTSSHCSENLQSLIERIQRGPSIFNVVGLTKIKVVHKPAQSHTARASTRSPRKK